MFKAINEQLQSGIKTCCYVIGLILLLAVVNLVMTVNSTAVRIAPEALETLGNIKTASASISASSASVQATSEAQAALLTNKKTQEAFALYLRGGKVYYRDLLRLSTSLDLLNKNLETIHDTTLPSINRTTDAATGLLNTGNSALAGIGAESQAVLREIVLRLQDPRLSAIIGSVADIADNVDGATEHIEASSAEIEKALPELLNNLNRLADGSAQSSAEVATFLKAINRPTTKKEKLWRALIQTAAIAAPTLLRR